MFELGSGSLNPAELASIEQALQAEAERIRAVSAGMTSECRQALTTLDLNPDKADD